MRPEDPECILEIETGVDVIRLSYGSMDSVLPWAVLMVKSSGSDTDYLPTSVFLGSDTLPRALYAESNKMTHRKRLVHWENTKLCL